MIIDSDLVAAAHAALERRFGERRGAATAVYTLEGNLYTSVSVECPGQPIEAETGALAAVYQATERVSAVVTVERLTDGGPVAYATPSGNTLDRLVSVGAREAEIAAHHPAFPGRFQVRTLKSLHSSHRSQIFRNGTFDAGMGPIAQSLRQFARVQGVPSVRSAWAPCLRSALAADFVRRRARACGYERHPVEFRHPVQAPQIELRHAWHAYEVAANTFFREVFDAHDGAFRRLGFNEDDLFHLRQGPESLHQVFANLIVWVAFHEPVESELPFGSHRTTSIQAGRPMHVAFQPAAERGASPLHELIELLTSREDVGVARYLRDRELFTWKLFPQGAGRCPFDGVALELLRHTGTALADAEADGLIMKATAG